MPFGVVGQVVPRMIFFRMEWGFDNKKSKFVGGVEGKVGGEIRQRNVMYRGRMQHCGVDVANRQLNDWTRLQWTLCMQHASPFSAMRGGDAAVPKLLLGRLVIISSHRMH